MGADEPFITRALEGRGMTLEQFLSKVDSNNAGTVSKVCISARTPSKMIMPIKMPILAFACTSHAHAGVQVELRKTLQKLGIAEEHTKHPDPFLNELDGIPSAEIATSDLHALLTSWKGPPSRQAVPKVHTRATLGVSTNHPLLREMTWP